MQNCDSEHNLTPSVDWPHAPIHRWVPGSAYLVTAGTYGKLHHFRGAERLSWLTQEILERTWEFGWRLDAWAIFSNHYHFVASPRPDLAHPGSLKEAIRRIHGRSAVHWNRADGAAGRKVWHNYWETQLSFERSYLARLQYVHDNAVHHRLVTEATAYPWCSARWLQQQATPAQYKVLKSFRTNTVRVPDGFEPSGDW